jgi:hypothetical protein
MPKAAAYIFADAFPHHLRPEAERATAALSSHLAVPREDSDSFFVVKVGQDDVRIPTRIYGHRVTVGEIWGAAAFEKFDYLFSDTDLSNEHILMCCCLLSRHHNGFVREAALSRLIAASKPYVAPFVTALASEYVYEILMLIHRNLGAFDSTTYGAFFVDNQAHHDLLRERMKSYWNVYYRWQDYTAFDGSFMHSWKSRYIGFDIFDAFDEMQKSSSKTFSQES